MCADVCIDSCMDMYTDMCVDIYLDKMKELFAATTKGVRSHLMWIDVCIPIADYICIHPCVQACI